MRSCNSDSAFAVTPDSHLRTGHRASVKRLGRNEAASVFPQIRGCVSACCSSVDLYFATARRGRAQETERLISTNHGRSNREARWHKSLLGRSEL